MCLIAECTYNHKKRRMFESIMTTKPSFQFNETWNHDFSFEFPATQGIKQCSELLKVSKSYRLTNVQVGRKVQN